MNAFQCPRCGQGTVRPNAALPGFLSCDLCHYVPNSRAPQVTTARAIELLEEAKATLAAVDYGQRRSITHFGGRDVESEFGARSTCTRRCDM